MRDREGTEIKVGNVVAMAITINQKRFSESFTIKVCKKNDKGRIILDGVWGWGYLKDLESNELQVVTDKTDLRSLCSEWIREFGDQGYDRTYVKSEDAHEFYEETCEIIKTSVYADRDVDLRKEKVLSVLRAVVNQSVSENGCKKILSISDIMDNAQLLRNKLDLAIKELYKLGQ